MLSKKLFSWMHKIALFAIVFASLAPSISHALATHQNVNTFSQEICTADGQVLIIQIVPNDTQQATISTEKESPIPANILHHLNHCPFCANPKMDNMMTALDVRIVTLLEMQMEPSVVLVQTVLPRSLVLPPPAQAPPSIH